MSKDMYVTIPDKYKDTMHIASISRVKPDAPVGVTVYKLVPVVEASDEVVEIQSPSSDWYVWAINVNKTKEE